jgi:hypothetical protein
VSGRKAAPKGYGGIARVRFRNTSFAAHIVEIIHSRLNGSDRDVSVDGTIRIDGLVDGSRVAACFGGVFHVTELQSPSNRLTFASPNHSGGW